jgi:hypothetical protein
MPVYGTLTLPTAIYPGDQALLIGTLASPSTPLSSAAGETKGTGAAANNALSERLILSGPWEHAQVNSVDVMMIFSANPGTFEFDMMQSDDDAFGAQSYLIIGTNKITTAALSPVLGSTLYIANLSMINVTGRSFAIFCTTQPPNACTVIAIVSR